MSFDSLDDVRSGGPDLVRAIVNSNTGMARHSQLSELLQVLAGRGFQYHRAEQFGPAGGRQIFYKNGLVTVRIKTKGDARGPREDVPHMSIGVTNGQGDRWSDDRAKLNVFGKLAPKSLTLASRFNPVDHDGEPQRFVVIQGGQSDQSEACMDEWANRTHFNFPAGFRDDISG